MKTLLWTNDKFLIDTLGGLSEVAHSFDELKAQNRICYAIGGDVFDDLNGGGLTESVVAWQQTLSSKQVVHVFFNTSKCKGPLSVGEVERHGATCHMYFGDETFDLQTILT
jgi:hypothetical protein